jgi:hypothetical protein
MDLPPSACCNFFLGLSQRNGSARLPERTTAHSHSTMKEPMRLRTCLQQGHGHRAGRLAHDGNVGGIATEGGNVPLHPLQPRDQVHDSVVARAAVAGFPCQLRMREETQCAQPVGQVHAHHTLSCQPLARIVGHAGRAHIEAAAVDPHDHGQVATGGRCPDVEVQAILADGLVAKVVVHRAGAQRLQAHGRIAVGMQHAIPVRYGLWRPPAQLPDRWRGEGHTQPGTDTGRQCYTFQLAGIDAYGLRGPRRGNCNCHQPQCQRRNEQPGSHG